jgi:hypothetical protein
VEGGEQMTAGTPRDRDITPVSEWVPAWKQLSSHVPRVWLTDDLSIVENGLKANGIDFWYEERLGRVAGHSGRMVKQRRVICRTDDLLSVGFRTDPTGILSRRKRTLEEG